MTVFAKLGKEGNTILCGTCRNKLGEMQTLPAQTSIYERGGPAVGMYEARPAERRPAFPGYVPNDDGIWRPVSHAQKRMIRAKKDGMPVPPSAFAHGQAGNMPAEFPITVWCNRCGTECLVDPAKW